MSSHKITLTDRYRHPLFFKETALELPVNSSSEYNLFQPLFNPDLQASYLSEEKPWEDIKKWVPILVEEWKVIEKSLASLYQSRSLEARPLMIEGISIFYMMLYWGNGRPVDLSGWEESVNDLLITCVNVHERLSFVMTRPDSYFAFIQLREMIGELHKLISKHLIMANKKTPG
ncbi:hypothetical protein E2R51_03330 [Jeotgalibacillus sp. S-D1]|uniref:YpoC family protein n=1 Tax=Jeotgalibacillus sp. S-D1 TaxID=2552189 RepID=UPI00105A9CDE|nr:hypothetical protein [Jeotgalibacillus sp. S-D1]TDL34765.1 hypothetical protein E2R51_03330 [Jeotgalibacillus sp. S-D1]